MQKLLVIGLGNPILGDDGAGWHAARAVSWLLQEKTGLETPGWSEANLLQTDFSHLKDTAWPSGWVYNNGENRMVEVDCLSVGGLGLMERMLGYQAVILIDALTDPSHSTGTVRCFSLQDLQSITKGHSASAHDASLQDSLEMGRRLGADIPEQVAIVGISTSAAFDFSEALSDAIAAAIPEAVFTVTRLLEEWMRSINKDLIFESCD